MTYPSGIGVLSPGKRKLLDQLLKKKGIHLEANRAISKRSKDVPVVLSFAQQRLWFLDQLEPDSSVYNIPDAFRVSGPLDIGALEQSLNEIIRRHEALRTTFSVVDDQPVQVVAPSLALKLEVVDLRDVPEGEREGETERLATEETWYPFEIVPFQFVKAPEH